MPNLTDIQKTNSTAAENFFEVVFENRISKFISVFLSIVFSFVLVLCFYGVIWFEKYGSDKKRTLINKLMASICWSSIAYCVIVQFPETFLYIYGPLPVPFCSIHLMNKRALVAQLLVFFDAIIIARYAFIFWLKNPSAFQVFRQRRHDFLPLTIFSMVKFLMVIFP